MNSWKLKVGLRADRLVVLEADKKAVWTPSCGKGALQVVIIPRKAALEVSKYR